MTANLIHSVTGSQVQPIHTAPVSPNVQAANVKAVSSDSVSASKAEQSAKTDLRVEQAVDKIKATVSSLAQDLHFSIDEDTGITVVKVMDSQTDEVIRQIPSEEAIAIARTLDKVQGLLFSDKA